MSTISIYSAQSQPFGLLSNDARVPMTINSVEYSSVTEYVYVNLFTNPKYRELMRENIREPNLTAGKLRNSEDEDIYVTAIKYGTLAKFSQSKQLRTRLFETKKTKLLINDPAYANDIGFINTLDKIRYPNFSDAEFIDAKYGLVSYVKINNVIAATLQRLMVDSNLASMPFSELEQLIPANQPDQAPNRDAVELVIGDLDAMVPILKIKYHNEIFTNERNRFGEHLLDAVLDYLLETHYPNLDPTEYNLAKTQQKNKNISALVKHQTDLVQLYENDQLDSKILKKLAYHPVFPPLIESVNPDLVIAKVAQFESKIDVTTIEEREAHVQNVYSTLTQPQEYATVIESNDPFLPSSPIPITINGQVFNSVVVYAYFKLYENIGLTKHVDVNAFANLELLVDEYRRLNNEKTVQVITANNEIATRHKYRNPSLAALLVTTGNATLVWGDETDGVLGFRDGNRMGAFLMFLRDELKTGPCPPISGSFTDDIVFSTWMYSRAYDYANVLKLFRTCSTAFLQTIYGIVASENVDVSQSARNVLNKAGLSDESQRLVMPMIAAEYAIKIKSRDRLSAIKKMVRSYDETMPTKATHDAAHSYLKLVYDQVKLSLRPDVTEHAFVVAVLSNSQDSNQEIWWRINYWSKLTPPNLIKRIRRNLTRSSTKRLNTINE